MATQGAEGQRLSRRRLLEWGVGIIAGLFSALLAIPLVGYLGSVLGQRTSQQWVRVCTLDQVNSTTPTQFRIAFRGENAPHGYEDVRGVFVIRKGGDVLAFTNVCTHMGCSVRWLDWRDQILCPCHGGTYDRWGNLIGGPPAHSLPLYVSRIEDNVLYVANRVVARG